MGNIIQYSGTGVVPMVLSMLICVQILLGFGTAYRCAKRGRDDGVALFGWLIVFFLAAYIPGLGIYLWYKYRHDPYPTKGQQPVNPKEGVKVCGSCGIILTDTAATCQQCGSPVR